MGLVLGETGEFRILTDILGSEDALGDMDFKVAGDETSLTAVQMDIKVEGITLSIIEAALAQASKARSHILQQMDKCTPPPRRQLSKYAPKIKTITIPVDKIGMVIGPGGRNIRNIEEQTGVVLQIEQDGSVLLKGPTDEAVEKASDIVTGMVLDPEVGRIYRNCRVVQVVPFGAFVEILPKKEGLLHISEWDVERTNAMADVVKEGDLVDVKLLVQEANGKLKLSRKAVLAEENTASE